MAKLAIFVNFAEYMLNTMKAAIIQSDIRWCEPEENHRLLKELMLEHKGAGIFVLPEMFSTGFATQPAECAEKEPSVSLEWMKRTADELDAAIVGSVSLQAGDGSFRNRCYFVKPDGSYEFYDKRHLFTYGGEHLRYASGDRRVIVEFRGVRFLLTVCYDLRFPMWSRNRNEYDAAICVASWPIARADVWKTLIRARAIENQCWFLAVNRVGDDPTPLHYSGDSAIIDPYGHPAAECTPEKVSVAEAELDMDALIAFREKFPVLKDTVIYSDWKNESFQ